MSNKSHENVVFLSYELLGKKYTTIPGVITDVLTTFELHKEKCRRKLVSYV